jgi:N-acyl-D-amino-acid deacylase
MKDTSARTRIVKDWNENRMMWDNRSGVSDWNGILITDCLSRPEVNGMTIAQIASQDRIAPIEAALDLVSLDDAQVVAVFFDQQEDILSKLMQHPLVAIGSDSVGAAPYGVLGKGSPHPRHYGTFPRVLGRFVREKSILSLEEAVKKMTSLTAKRFNLDGRGVVRVGAWADLVLFDARTVIDKATFADPHQYPEGIPYVIVNGEIVLDKGEHTGALPGRVL